jgi:hypothetical protein
VSTWRRKALELFPDLRDEIQSPEMSIYQVFFELVPRCREAHERGDVAELKRIYGFAEWCAKQRSKDLSNAAGVAFYEHLADSNRTLEAIPQWVSKSVFDDIAGLLEAQVGPERVAQLRRQYK